MKSVLKIYRMMLQHWGYLVLGLIFMAGFAISSGVSVTMAIPLFDYIFSPDKSNITINTLNEFIQQLSNVLANFDLNVNTIFTLNEEALAPLISDLKLLLMSTDSMLLLYMVSGLTISLIVLKNISFYCYRLSFANLKGRTIEHIRNTMFDCYIFQPLQFFGKNRIGDSLVRMINDVNIVGDLFIESLFNVLRDLFLLFVYARIAFLLNWKLFCFSLLLLPIFSIVINFVGKKIKKYARKIQEQSSNMFANVEETLNNVMVVKTFAKEDFESNKFRKINSRYFRFWRKSLSYSYINTPLSELNGTITGVLVLLVGGRLVLNNSQELTIGSFIAFLLAIFSMLHPMKTITKAYAGIRRALVSLDRISAILDLDQEHNRSKRRTSKKDFSKDIVIQNAHFTYDNDTLVLNDVSLDINKGEKVAIVGSSGSGKTTLINLIPGFYQLKHGSISIDSVNILDIKLDDLRGLFGIVTQESLLFHDSVKNNIVYGAKSQVTDDDVFKALEIAYADEFVNQMPEGIDTIIDPKASNLSGGQKQRLCIARSIIGNPPILIFDEATSALDSIAEKKVQKAIEQATENKTVIMIAHRLSTILSADKIIVLQKGMVVGIGKHSELLKTCPQYEILYKMQFQSNDIEGKS